MSHRVTLDWMGKEVETLDDLLRPGLTAVNIGVNPAPNSVTAGHYYQGRLGQRHFGRLHDAGLLPDGDGREDDRAFAAGLGFTDLVKRPTRRATEVMREEIAHGRKLVEAKLLRFQPGLVILTFQPAAKAWFPDVRGHGFLGEVAGIEAFLMPGAYKPDDEVRAAIEELRGYLSQRQGR